jgi:hypothetical protein|tara:strand:- start:11 stop:202 length:192 start_codon:yes stop_codon:yes gene_type:complete
VKKSKVIAVGYENIRLEPWNGPPYIYSVKVNGKIKRMSGFDEEHIKNQLYPKKATMIRKIKDV